MTHSDIDDSGWIQKLPAQLRPFALLMRLDRPIGTWLLLLPGWWAIVLATGGIHALDAKALATLFLFAIGAVIMRGAGCVINDLWDRDLDMQVQRTRNRPLASGVIGKKQALIFLVILLLMGLAILLQFNSVAIALGGLSMLFVVSYPAMKRLTWWPQAFLGLTFNFGALIGWAAIDGRVTLAPLLLYMAGFFWTLGYDTIYAHQDREDDMRVGIKSSALRLGLKSRVWVGRFYGVAVLLLLGSFIVHGANGLSFLILGAAGLHLAWQVRAWRVDDPASSLAIFRSNRDFGLIVFLAAALCGL